MERYRDRLVPDSGAVRRAPAGTDHLYADLPEEKESRHAEYGLHEHHALCNADLLRLVRISGAGRCRLLLGMLVFLLPDPERRSELLLHQGAYRGDLRKGKPEERQEICQRQKELHAAYDGRTAGQ